jgi:biotin operon repressor
MEIKKPELTNKQELANQLYFYLLQQNDFVSKEQIGEVLGIKNERSVRDIIALLSTKKPIISHSGNKGYLLAKRKEDLENVERTWAELSKRIREMQARIEPLIKFRDRVKYNIKGDDK